MSNIIVIPAYQPDYTLVQLVKKLKSYTVIVVDDGSGEAYANIFFEVERQSVTILSYEKNRGKGYALKYAFRYISEKCLDVEWVITADADGQHCAEDIVHIIECELNNQYGVITGVRKFVGKVPLRSRVGNYLIQRIFLRMSGLDLADTQCGLRAYRYDLLPLFCKISGERYEYEMGCLIYCVINKVKIAQIDIETIYEKGNKSSHFRPVVDSAKICRQFFSLKMRLSKIDNK